MSDVTGTFYADDGAFIGYGAELLVGQNDGSPESFASIKGVKRLKMGAFTTGVVDKTHLRSLNRAREKKATIRDYEPISFTMTWDPSHGSQSIAGGDGFTDGGLLSIHQAVEERNFKLIVPDGSPATELPFRGSVTKFDPGELTVDGIVEVSVEITPLADYLADMP